MDTCTDAREKCLKKCNRRRTGRRDHTLVRDVLVASKSICMFDENTEIIMDNGQLKKLKI